MTRLQLPPPSDQHEPQLALLGLGTAALGRPAYLTTNHGHDLRGRTSIESMARNAIEVFDFAYRHGIRYFDTARSYGRAEEFLATWLHRREPRDIFVASKWGYEYVGDWQTDALVHERKDHSIDAFRRQVVQTQAFLGRHLDLYQVHSVTPTSPVLGDRALQRQLMDLKLTGVGVGLSTSGPNQADVLEQAAEIEFDGVPLFDAVQVTWNLLDQSAGDTLQSLNADGVAVVIKEALANGRLGPRGDRANQVESPEVSADASAIAAVMQQPFADVVLSGAVTKAQLQSNLAASIAPTWSPDRVASLALDPNDYWAQRATRTWT